MRADNQLSLTTIVLAAAGLVLAAAVIVSVRTYLGFRRYKKPLLEVDATLIYSFTHYLRLVVFPRLAYRIRAKLPSKGRS